MLSISSILVDFCPELLEKSRTDLVAVAEAASAEGSDQEGAAQLDADQGASDQEIAEDSDRAPEADSDQEEHK